MWRTIAGAPRSVRDSLKNLIWGNRNTVDNLERFMDQESYCKLKRVQWGIAVNGPASLLTSLRKRWQIGL